MKLQDYTKFANEEKVCYLATTEGDQPRVRGFLMWYADESGFYFHTGATKSVCKQLRANPKIEVCFYRYKNAGEGTMMRICGKVEFIENQELKEKLFNERPFLKKIGEGDPNLLQIFRIYTGEVYFWTMADNLIESEIPRLKF